MAQKYKDYPDWLKQGMGDNQGGSGRSIDWKAKSLPTWLTEDIDVNKYKAPAVQMQTTTAPAPLPQVDVVAGAKPDTSNMYLMANGTYRPRQWGDNILEAWDNSTTAQSFKSGLYGMAKDLTNLPRFIFKGLEQRDIEDQKRQEDFLQQAGFRNNTIWDPKDIQHDSMYKPIIDSLQNSMNDLEAQRTKIHENLAKKNLSTGQQIYSQAVEAIPEVLGSAFAGALTDGGSLATEVPQVMGKWGKVIEIGNEIKKMLPFGTIAFSGYQQEAEKEGANYTEQALYGLTGATAEVASEFIMMPSWLKNSMKIKGTTDIIQKGIDKVSGAYGRTALTFMADIGKEAIQEMAVDPVNALSKRLIYKPDTPIIDYSQISQDGLTGGAMSAIMGAFGLRGEYKSHKEAISMMDNYQKTGQTPTVEDQQQLIKDFNKDLEEANKTGDLKTILDEGAQETQKDIETVIDGLDKSGININDVYDTVKNTIGTAGQRTVSAPKDIEGDPQLWKKIRDSLADEPLNLDNVTYRPQKVQSLWQKVKTDMNYKPEGLVIDNLPDKAPIEPIAQPTTQEGKTVQPLPQTPTEAKIEAPGQAETPIGQPTKEKTLSVRDEINNRVINTPSVQNAFKNSDKQNAIIEIKKALKTHINDMMVKDPGGLGTTNGVNNWDNLLKEDWINKKAPAIYDTMQKQQTEAPTPKLEPVKTPAETIPKIGFSGKLLDEQSKYGFNVGDKVKFDTLGGVKEAVIKGFTEEGNYVDVQIGEGEKRGNQTWVNRMYATPDKLTRIEEAPAPAKPTIDELKKGNLVDNLKRSVAPETVTDEMKNQIAETKPVSIETKDSLDKKINTLAYIESINHRSYRDNENVLNKYHMIKKLIEDGDLKENILDKTIRNLKAGSYTIHDGTMGHGGNLLDIPKAREKEYKDAILPFTQDNLDYSSKYVGLTKDERKQLDNVPLYDAVRDIQSKHRIKSDAENKQRAETEKARKEAEKNLEDNVIYPHYEKIVREALEKGETISDIMERYSDEHFQEDKYGEEYPALHYIHKAFIKLEPELEAKKQGKTTEELKNERQAEQEKLTKETNDKMEQYSYDHINKVISQVNRITGELVDLKEQNRGNKKATKDLEGALRTLKSLNQDGVYRRATGVKANPYIDLKLNEETVKNINDAIDKAEKALKMEAVKGKKKLEPVKPKAEEKPAEGKNKYDYPGWNGAAESIKADANRIIPLDEVQEGDIVAPVSDKGNLSRIFTVTYKGADSVSLRGYEHDQTTGLVSYTYKQEKKAGARWQVLNKDQLINYHKDRIQYEEQTIKNRGANKYWQDALDWHREKLAELEKAPKKASLRDTPFYKYNADIVSALDDNIEKALDVIQALNKNAPDGWKGNLIKSRRIKQIINEVVDNPEITEKIFNIVNETEGAKADGKVPIDTNRDNVQETPAGVQPEAVPGVEGQRDTGEGDLRHPGEGEGADSGIDRPGTESRPSMGDNQGADISQPGKSRKPVIQSKPKGNDYLITTQEDVIKGKGAKTRYEQNVEAIKLMRQIEAEQRPATAEEQKILAQYVGWGGIPQAFAKEAYKENGEWKYKGVKDWEKEYEELKNLLSEEEYRLANDTILNAHYTSIPVIKGMYEGLEHFGFTGGNVLEPAVGIGNFLGSAPPELRSKINTFTGIEIDPITARIAKLLYPNADIRLQGFEKAKLPANFYDVAISNVPFGKIEINDAKYPKTITRAIHNYFFAKALDTVRPGGLVMFVTSSKTLDSQDTAGIRALINKNADFIGAIRLPNTAFKENANTEVVTDILVLRKKIEGQEFESEPFMDMVSAIDMVPEGSDFYWQRYNMEINQYYEKHPENILGTINIGRDNYGNIGLTVKGDDRNLQEGIADAMNKMKGNIITPAEKPIKKLQQESDIAERKQANEKTKEGSYELSDGKLYVNVEGKLEPAEINPKDVKKITGLVQIRDKARELLNMEQTRQEQPKIDKARKELNKIYDKFVGEFGYINKPTNLKSIVDDPEVYFLMALENYDKKTKTATKNENIFVTGITGYQPITSVETGKEALVVSLNETGIVSMDRMMKLTGKDENTLQEELQGLIFKNPTTGAFEPADQYLSGNVRAKLREAEGMASVDPQYQYNVEELKKVQPTDKKPHEVSVKLGSGLISDDIYIQFAKNLFGSSADVVINQNPITGEYNVYEPKKTRYSMKKTTNNVATWGIDKKGFTALELIEKIMNNKSIMVYDTYKDGDRTYKVLNSENTALAQEKAEKLKQAFSDFVTTHDNGNLLQQIADNFNEVYNTDVLRQFNGQHLTFPGMNRNITLEAHQKDAVWRVISSGGNTLLAHEVGAGKTFEIIASAMELRRLGLAKKPLIVVPKAVVEQWGNEFRRLYPGAKLLLPGKADFEPKNRKALMNRIALGDYDSIIITEDQFKMIPMSEETVTRFFNKMIDEAEEALLMAKAEAKERGEKESTTEKQLTQRLKNLRTKMEKKLDSIRKDTENINFEELGIDSLFVDEAHKFKNLMYVTKLQVSGLGNPEGSDKAFDLLMKIRYLQALNGGRGIGFATATPILNSISEVYNWQQYLQPNELEARGIKSFDKWVSVFGKIEDVVEVKPDGNGYRVKKGFARLTNVGQLVQMFRSFADIKTQDDLKLKRPDIKTGQYIVKSIPASSWLKAYMKEIGDRAVAINEGKVNPEDDNMLKITSDGRKSALDPRLIDPSYIREDGDTPSKIDFAVEHLYQQWNETKDDRLTHLAFLELSVPKPASKKAEEGIDDQELTEDVPDKQAESMYQDIKNRLIEKGVPADEIAFIHDAKTDAQRLELQTKFNDGEIRILIGNNEKMGVGINLQKRTKSITHIDFPWRPKDLQQEDGRGLRQGNLNKEIELYALVTEGSFDARLWDNLQRKSRFIDDLMSADVSLTEVEDVGVQTLSFQEVVGIASGNPLMKEQVDITQKINKLQALEKGYKKRKFEFASKIRDLTGEVQQHEVAIEGLNKDLKLRKDFTGDKFAIEIDGRKFTERDKANDFLVGRLTELLKQFKEDRAGKQTIKLKFAGIIKELEASKSYVTDMLALYYKSDNMNYYGEFFSSTADVIQSLEAKMRNLEKTIAEREIKIKEAKDKIKGYEKETLKTFDQGDELARLIARQNEIMNELNPPQNVNAGDESEDGEAPKKPGTADEETAREFSVIDRVKNYDRKDFNMEMAEENDTLDQLERIKNASTNKTVQSAIEQHQATLKVSLEELKNLREEKIKELNETPEQAREAEKQAEIQGLADQIDRITASLNILNPVAENPVTPISEKRDYRRWITNSNFNSRVTPEEMNDFYRDNPHLYEYDVVSNNQMLDKANNAVEADMKRVIEYLRAKENLANAYDSALVMAVAKKLIMAGEISRATAWQAEMAERMTRLGQAVQILSVWKKYTPEWALRKTQKDIEDTYTKKEKDKLDGTSEALADELNTINKEAVNEVVDKFLEGKDVNEIVKEAYSDPATVKEVETTKAVTPEAPESHQVVEGGEKPAGKKKKLEPIKNKGKKAEENIDDEEASLPEVIGSLMLQKKIEKNMEPKEQKERDLLREMVNTLYEIGRPAMPIAERQKVTTPMEFIKQAMADKELYKATWDRARTIMEDKYKDEPGVLELLDNFFGSYVDKPFADVTLDKAVAQEIRDKKLNINELIKKNPFAVEHDINSFINEAIGEGLSPANAKLLASYMKRKMDKIVADRRQAKLEGMRKTLDPIIKKPKKTPAQTLSELSNLGIFKFESQYVTNKYMDRIVNQGIKYADINLSKLIREHYSSYNMAEQNLLMKLTEAGINAEDAEFVTTYITNKFKQITEARKEATIERMFGEKPDKAPKKKKEFYQRIIELSNMGLFSKEQYRSYVAKAFGMTALSNESAMEIVSMANKIQEMEPGRAKDEAIGLMLDRIASEVPVSILQRIGTIQTMAQLLNTKTIIRNLTSNLAFTGYDTLAQMANVPLDIMMAKGLKIFGKSIIKGTGVRTTGMPIPREFWIGFKEGLKIGISDAKRGISTTGGIGTAYDLPKRTFRKGVLSWFEKGLNMSMSAVDYAVKRGVYRESLAIQMKLSKATAPTQAMIEYATNLANYRTFNDENNLSLAFMGLKKLLNNPVYFMTKKGKPSAWGVGDLLIKYPKTPANLIMRGFEYSPLGLLKTVGEIYNPLRGKKKFDQNAFTMSLTRALMGSVSLYALGALLHHLGILLGGPDDDYDLRKLKENVGLGAYRINVSALKRFVESGFNPKASKLQQGDTIYSYDWFQPFSFPLVMGANVDEAKGINKNLSIVSAIAGSLEAGMQTVESQPLIQGLTRFLQTKSISQGAINMLQGVPSSFMPTALNQIKQLVDNQTYETYNPMWELEAITFAMNKIPGLSNLILRHKIDSFGQDKPIYQGGTNNLFNVFFNPGFLTQYQPSKEAKLVMDTYAETGTKTQIPREVQPKIQYNNQSYTLTPAQYEQYKRLVGTMTKQAYSKYTNLAPNADTAKKLTSVLNKVNEEAKVQILKSMGVNTKKGTSKTLVPIR